jgi:hypothetical protein
MGYEEKKERRRRYLEDGEDEVSLNAFISPVPRKGCPVSWGSLLAGQSTGDHCAPPWPGLVEID